MEPIKLFGIVFRSSSHMLWFIMTMVLLGESTVVSVICVRIKLYIGPAILFSFLGILSLTISIAAVGVTEWGTINGPKWSADCIWYNALLAGLYFSAAAFFGYCFLYQYQLAKTP
ncbi:MAG: hypothetical protein HYS44_01130 [Candidatus Niyogibacteria bacterium]|nr:hypothetical protein [Candidatus Niyogibacteria bacterium]